MGAKRRLGEATRAEPDEGGRFGLGLPAKGQWLGWGYTILFGLHSLWLLSGLLGTWAFGAWPYGSDAAYYFVGFSQTTALLIPQLFVSLVLRSAALRDRLSGTTFKTLNLSLLFSSVLLFVAEVVQSIAEGGVGFKMICAALTASLSTAALRKHGMPQLKLLDTLKAQASGEESNSLARAYTALCAIAVLGAVLNSLGSGLLAGWLKRLTTDPILEAHHFLTYSALLCAQAGSLLTLQSAAVVGAKRLASDTYQKLNLGGVLSASFTLLSFLWALKMKCKLAGVFCIGGLINLALLGVSFQGLYRGQEA